MRGRPLPTLRTKTKDLERWKNRGFLRCGRTFPLPRLTEGPGRTRVSDDSRIDYIIDTTHI